MENLEFCDKHNMVAYLKKPTGSEGFQEIVDFLNGSHIRLALTKNPTIYVSLIEKFWQTATVRTVDNGKEFTITEASVRRHLQLIDAEGINVLPTTKFFVQLSLIGNMKRGFSEEHTPLFPSTLAIQPEEGEGSGYPSKPQPPPSTAQPIHGEPIPNITSEPIPNIADGAVYEEWDDRVERATTTVASLDAAQASGNITKTQSTTIPNVPFPQGIGAGGSPRVNTLGSDEGSMQLQELMALCTTLSDRVLALETDLRQTKKVYGAAYTKLIMKVKKLEKTVKSNQARRRAKIEEIDEEDLEDISKQGRMIEEIDQNAGVTLITPTHSQEDQPEDQLGVFSAAKVLVDAAKNVHTYTRRRRAVSTGSGKRIMEESEEEQSKRTKLQQEQDRLGHEAAARLQEELDEEERQRRARVHATNQSFTKEEWENIRERFDSKTTRRGKKKNVNTFVPMETEDRGRASELAARSSQATITDSEEVKCSKRAAEAELDHEGSKRQKTNEASGSVQEQPDVEEKELS
ncbi:hypothetical protein Tco_0987550 [Tanacetum coccineum]